MNIVKNYDLDVETLEFHQPEKRGKKYISYISKDEQPLFIQSSKLNVLKVEENEKFLVAYIQLDSELLQTMKELEEKSKYSCFHNSKQWFKGKRFSHDFITRSFRSSLNGDVLKAHIPIHDNEIQSEVYNQYKQKIKFSEKSLMESDNVLILNVSGIWLSGHHIGLTINIVQIKSYFKKTPLKGYYIDDGELSSDSDYPSDLDSNPERTFFDDLIEEDFDIFYLLKSLYHN